MPRFESQRCRLRRPPTARVLTARTEVRGLQETKAARLIKKCRFFITRGLCKQDLPFKLAFKPEVTSGLFRPATSQFLNPWRRHGSVCMLNQWLPMFPQPSRHPTQNEQGAWISQGSQGHFIEQINDNLDIILSHGGECAYQLLEPYREMSKLVAFGRLAR